MKPQRTYMHACEPLESNVKGKEQVTRLSRKKKNSSQVFLRQLRLLVFSYVLLFFVLPYTCQKIWDDLCLNQWHNSAIKFEANDYTNQASQYMTKNTFLGSVQDAPSPKKTLMHNMYDAGHMYVLENQLKAVSGNYHYITPHIFVWDYTSGKSVRINSDQTVATASIIKLPILFELFRRIDKGLLRLDDKMLMSQEFVTGGSGHLQYQQANQYLTVNKLAQLMIQDSDNTATNMLLSKVGGVNSINQNTKLWGVGGTHMGNWLPDLTGTNVTTAEQMGKILYNLDNPELLSLASRSKIVDIMSNVKNVYLIQAGIGRDAEFIHKTGNIGSMIGDAGIVEMPNGHKYIVVIMVERPHNYHAAKDFIIEASRTIYNYMAVNS
jgi:beta-lactamase class A